MVHCPACGRRAAVVGVKEVIGTYYMVPAYQCDTDGCEFSKEGPNTWIPVLRG